jgi:hypothetical protein
MKACAVHQCDYVVEAYLDDFPVCALHDARQTRGILELLELPCAGWSYDRPIVYRAGIALELKHFKTRESRGNKKAFDDPRILNADTAPTRIVHPDWNLTVE